MSRDPAVVDWAAAFREVTGRDLPCTFGADRRSPRDVERDNGLEDIAEARADFRSYDYDALADEAADNHYRDRCC